MTFGLPGRYWWIRDNDEVIEPAQGQFDGANGHDSSCFGNYPILCTFKSTRQILVTSVLFLPHLMTLAAVKKKERLPFVLNCDGFEVR